MMKLLDIQMKAVMAKTVLALLLTVVLSGCTTPPAALDTRQPARQAEAVDSIGSLQSHQIESAFSPGAGGERLVLKVISSANQEVRLAAYSFTSPAIVKALIAAEKRGVDVRVVVDDKGNRGKANIASLNLLVNAGISVRTNASYAIHHDKYIVVDGCHVQNGSFNYSNAAAKSNSENVLVVWNDANLANSFLKHWQSRWDQGSVFISTY